MDLHRATTLNAIMLPFLAAPWEYSKLRFLRRLAPKDGT